MTRRRPDALDRRTFLALTAAGAGAAALGASPVAGATARPTADRVADTRTRRVAQPNIVLITADDLG